MLKRFVRDIGHYFKKLYFMDVWRKKNKHNFTIAGEVFNINKVVVGNGTYGKLNVQCYGNSKEKLVIGNYCSISDNVNFILGGNHPYDIVTTYPIYKKIINNKQVVEEILPILFPTEKYKEILEELNINY